jgi:hypothetical protein
MVKVVIVERKKKRSFMAVSERNPTLNKDAEEQVIDALLNDIDCFDSFPVRTSDIQHRFPLIRIPKSDIRRKYSLMLCNSMNSCDFRLISSFFDRFVHPAVEFQKIAVSGISQVVGRECVSHFFGGWLLLSPDKTTRLSDIQLKQSSTQEETVLVSNYHQTFTRVYSIQAADFADKYLQVHSCCEENERKKLKTIEFEEEKERTEKEKEQNIVVTPELFHVIDLYNPCALEGIVPRLAKAVPASSEGTLSLTMNAKKEIVGITLAIGILGAPTNVVS